MLPVMLLTSVAGNLLIAQIEFSDAIEPTLGDWIGIYLLFLIKAIFYALDVGLFLFFMKLRIYGERVSNIGVLLAFLPKIPRLLFLTLVAATLIFAGLVMLIIPGVLLALRFSYAWLYFVFEEHGTFNALWRSFKETKAELGIIVKSIIFVLLPLTILLVVLLVLSAILGLNEGFAFLALSLVGSFVLLFLQVVFYRIYAQYGDDNEPN